MREDVKKVLFLGVKASKEQFFKKAQRLGQVHFINPTPETRKHLPEQLQQTADAIRVLRGLAPTDQEENFSGLNAEAIVTQILDLNQQKEHFEEEMHNLETEISRAEIYGHFSFDDMGFIKKEGKRNLQFFAARAGLFQEIDLADELLYVATDHGLDYYVAITERPKLYDKMVELKLERPLGDLRTNLRKDQHEHQRIEHQLKGYAKYNHFLHAHMVELLNRYHLADAETYVQSTMDDTLFAVEGWVPVNKIDAVDELAKKSNIFMEEVAIEPTDVVPTCLQNEGVGRVGEDLVHVYDTPSATDKDPSYWVLVCFTLFFAFIIGDAGYGLIFLLIALYLRFKFPDVKGVGKRVLTLFTILSIGCIVWGTIMTAFFGLQISKDNPLRKVSLLHWMAEKKVAYHLEHKDATYKEWVHDYPDIANLKDPREILLYTAPSNPHKEIILNKIADNVMFELALFIGCVHLIISMFRYANRSIHNVGWAVFIFGTYLYMAEYLQLPTILNYIGGIDVHAGAVVGFQLLIGGIAFAWISAIIMHGWKGIFEIVALIQVFSDVLSYLRLYALGLAGAIVAQTINEIAGGLPLVYAVLLTLVSHLVNVVLSTMSGIIHGLRLNYLEWYHYSFEGGGRPFQPLKLLKME